jgi:hypothetical protein
MRQRVRLGAVVGAALLVCACGSGPKSLRAATRSLVPESSTIVVERTGDCVEFASEPSCADVFYTNPGRSQAERVALVRKAAEDGHWKSRGESVLAGATWLRYRRGSYQASVWVLIDERAAACANDPRKACADLVHVVRD